MRNRWMAWLVAALALVGALCLSGCGDDDSDPGGLAGGVEYDDPQGRFSLTIPKGWVPDRSEAATRFDLAFIASVPDPSGGTPFTPNITIDVSENATSDLADAARSVRESNLADLQMYDANTDERVALAHDHPGQLLGGIYKGDPVRVQILQLLVQGSGTGYLIQVTTPVASFPDTEDTLRKALLSFTLKQNG